MAPCFPGWLMTRRRSVGARSASCSFRAVSVVAISALTPALHRWLPVVVAVVSGGGGFC